MPAFFKFLYHRGKRLELFGAVQATEAQIKDQHVRLAAKIPGELRCLPVASFKFPGFRSPGDGFSSGTDPAFSGRVALRHPWRRFFDPPVRFVSQFFGERSQTVKERQIQVGRRGKCFQLFKFFFAAAFYPPAITVPRVSLAAGLHFHASRSVFAVLSLPFPVRRIAITRRSDKPHLRRPLFSIVHGRL